MQKLAINLEFPEVERVSIETVASAGERTEAGQRPVLLLLVSSNLILDADHCSMRSSNVATTVLFHPGPSSSTARVFALCFAALAGGFQMIHHTCEGLSRMSEPLSLIG